EVSAEVSAFHDREVNAADLGSNYDELRERLRDRPYRSRTRPEVGNVARLHLDSLVCIGELDRGCSLDHVECLVAFEEVVVGSRLGTPETDLQLAPGFRLRFKAMELAHLDPVDDVRLIAVGVDTVDHVRSAHSLHGASSQLGCGAPELSTISAISRK